MGRRRRTGPPLLDPPAFVVDASVVAKWGFPEPSSGAASRLLAARAAGHIALIAPDLLVPELGAFVRCLLPVRLEGGHTITFGVWVGVSSDDLQRAWKVWWEPEYADLELTGALANALPGVDVLAAPVVVRVRDVEETPYVDSSSDALLTRVLSEEFPHDQVLDLLQ